MSKVNKYLSVTTQLQLHYQRMREATSIPPITLEPQEVRQDFIQYCIGKGKTIDEPQKILTEYIKYINDKQNTSTSTVQLTPETPPALFEEDLNRQ